MAAIRWTHPSVRTLKVSDPRAAVEALARELALGAIEAGWAGPPFDPLELAKMQRIEVVATDTVPDARLIPGTRPRIEFNPNKPRARIRFSLAHEMAHTLFPDWKEAARSRGGPESHAADDDWQLELLCNVAAAELLMPAGALPQSIGQDFTELMNLSKTFDVSPEAAFLRAARATPEPLAVFAAASEDPRSSSGSYRVDYVIPSPAMGSVGLQAGQSIEAGSVLSHCSAVGYTARGKLPGTDLEAQCVGLPPYPGHRFPRVLGLLSHPRRGPGAVARLDEVIGDATAPRGGGTRILAFVVNDRTPRWGGGFALAVKRLWPGIQREFVAAASAHPETLRLGSVFISQLEPGIIGAALVAQHGYGPSARPRLRYAALRKALDDLAATAQEMEASVHMPQIGAGEAGGRWEVIRGLVSETLVASGVPVSVYRRAEDPDPAPPELTLFG